MSLLDKRIEDYRDSITPVGYNALKRDKILTFRDLVPLTEQEVLRTPNLGRCSLNSIKELLYAQEPRLRLGMTEEEIEKLDTSPEETTADEGVAISEARLREILAAVANTLVGCTSPGGMSRLMSFDASPMSSDEPGVLVALMLAQKAKLTLVEYQTIFGPAVSQALANLIGGKEVTIKF